MGQMIVEMGMIRGPQESLVSIFTWSSIFPNHLERISDVLKECVMDQPTDRRTDKASYRDTKTHLIKRSKMENEDHLADEQRLRPNK